MAAEELSADSIKGDFHIASTQATPHSPQGSNSPRALASAYQAGMSHCPPDPASMTTTTTPHQPSHPPPSRVGFGSKATTPHRSPSQLWAQRHCLVPNTLPPSRHELFKPAPEAPKLPSVAPRSSFRTTTPCPLPCQDHQFPTSSPPTPPRPHTNLTSPGPYHSRVSSASCET